MPIAVDDVFLCSTIGECAGQRIQNTFYYYIKQIDPGATYTDLEAQQALNVSLFSDTAGNLKDKLMACLPMNYNLRETWVQKVFPARYRKTVDAQTDAGDITIEALATNIAAVIGRYGAEGNRHNIGSLHVGPLPTSDDYFGNGVLSVTYRPTLIALADQLKADVTIGSGTLVTFGPCLFAAVGTPVKQPIIATALQDTVRTMRRRTVRVGI